jgi:hypothetical protein
VASEIDRYLENERKSSNVATQPSKPDALAAEVIAAAVTVRKSTEVTYKPNLMNANFLRTISHESEVVSFIR